MRDRGVKKVTGYSWIEIQNKTHTFSVGDAEKDEIYAFMEDLDLRMKKAGPKPSLVTLLISLTILILSESLCKTLEANFVFAMDSLSSSSTTKMKKNNKLYVRNQTRFKKSFLLAREKTILKKALELSILCDNQICVIHYDRDGNLVNTMPEDQSQKNTNLSQFYNKKLVDENRRSLTDAEERKRFTKKVGEFKGSLEDKFHIFRDLLYSQDHQTEQDQSPFLDVMFQENHKASSYGFFPANDFSSSLIEEDPLMNFCPQDLDQQQSFSDLLMSGDHVSTITDQYLLSPASSSTVCSFNHHQSKFSVFLFNHETASFTQLPNSASSSFDQGLIGSY
ncbi:hypothetical protein Bca4012_065044 [Brassica carinata]|uniref:MADS-box domain-containing protein n=1 Tax=Brassica carinata TaxID=52824 RepID=A0A8X7VN78_BRACI|nr:hypothetical protein Bca52824_017498 [Brassica carinata]